MLMPAPGLKKQEEEGEEKQATASHRVTDWAKPSSLRPSSFDFWLAYLAPSKCEQLGGSLTAEAEVPFFFGLARAPGE